jgi:UrcA family protein
MKSFDTKRGNEEATMTSKTDSRSMLTTACASLALLWAGVGIDCAIAAPPYDSPPPQVLKVTDLDLSRPADVVILYKRIYAAAVDVCKPWNGDSTGAKAVWDSCRDATVSGTVAKVNLPALTAYYMFRTGHAEAAAMTARNQ